MAINEVALGPKLKVANSGAEFDLSKLLVHLQEVGHLDSKSVIENPFLATMKAHNVLTAAIAAYALAASSSSNEDLTPQKVKVALEDIVNRVVPKCQKVMQTIRAANNGVTHG